MTDVIELPIEIAHREASGFSAPFFATETNQSPAPQDIVQFAQNHPFLKGGVRRNGTLYCAFSGANSGKLFLFTARQIEHMVWHLAECPRAEATRNDALSQYALGLRRAVHNEIALTRNLIRADLFFDCSHYDDAHLVPGIPEGVPKHLQGNHLRDLLGNRHPELDDRFKKGSLIEVLYFTGDDGVLKAWRPRLRTDETISLYSNAAALLGTDFWDNITEDSPPAKTTPRRPQMVGGQNKDVQKKKSQFSSLQMR
jgi:hypothetical protein